MTSVRRYLLSLHCFNALYRGQGEPYHLPRCTDFFSTAQAIDTGTAGGYRSNAGFAKKLPVANVISYIFSGILP